MNSALAAFITGLIFAVGLAISGMTQPGKVIAFLDLFGNWDPSLGDLQERLYHLRIDQSIP